MTLTELIVAFGLGEKVGIEDIKTRNGYKGYTVKLISFLKRENDLIFALFQLQYH